MKINRFGPICVRTQTLTASFQRAVFLGCVAFSAVAVQAGCGDNLSFSVGPAPFEPLPIEPLTCVPNLDGQIVAAELTPALGVPVNYLVNPAGTEREVDLEGVVDDLGRRLWLFAVGAADKVATLEAKSIAGSWYAGGGASGNAFPVDAVVVAYALDGSLEMILQHTDAGLLFLGLASREADPPEGRTLWAYSEPVLLYRFPLRDGDNWVAASDVRNGTVRGLPYAGRDTYEIAVRGAGRLELPDITFTQALKVSTRVTAKPAVGNVISRRQVSFLFECYGEVARATSFNGETDEDFVRAVEVRQLGF